MMHLAGEVPSFAQFKASYRHRHNGHKLRQHQFLASPPPLATTAAATNMILNPEQYQRDQSQQPSTMVGDRNDDIPSEITIFPEDQYCSGIVCLSPPTSPIPTPPQQRSGIPSPPWPLRSTNDFMTMPLTSTTSAVRRIRPLRQRVAVTMVDDGRRPITYIEHDSHRKTWSWEIYRLFVLCVVLCGGLLLSLYRIGTTSTSA